MIFVTGDLHGDRSRFKNIKKSKIKKGDTLLVCGDFGFIWDGSKKESSFLEWIGKRNYHVAFVDGYNDNLDLIKKFPETQWNNGNVRTISGKLVMLLRGEVYDIENKKVFAFGGGVSNEREHSSDNDADKLPSIEEMQNALNNLLKCDNKVDIIVTHDAPSKIKLFLNMDNNDVDYLQTFLENISKSVKFKNWYFGKYHNNKVIPPCYNIVYTKVLNTTKLL